MMLRTVKRFCRYLCLFMGTSVVAAGSVLAVTGSVVEMPVESGGPFAVPVTSLKNMRFRNTIHQQYDFSCGSAALATLLTHHYGFRVSEEQVFNAMFEHGDQAKIRKEGFSLLDIKMYLQANGFEADGYVAGIEELAKVGVPAIVLIKENGYHHFIVVKGLRNGRVLVGDPSSGTRALPYAKFKDIWVNGILFVISNKLDLARFNSDADWRVAPRAPIADGVHNNTLGTQLPKYGPSDF